MSTISPTASTTSFGLNAPNTASVVAQSARTTSNPQSLLGDIRGKSVEEIERKAHKAAEDWVAMTLIQPILREARENNHAEGPFAPGPYEKQFGALHDAAVAREIAHSARMPIADRVAQDLLRAAGIGAHSAGRQSGAEHGRPRAASTGSIETVG